MTPSFNFSATSNFQFAYLYTCIASYLHTCMLACSWFSTASKSDFKMLSFSFYGKISKHGATGQYWSLMDNISKCLRILGHIWQYLKISKCSLQFHKSYKSELKLTLDFSNIEQYRTILGILEQYMAILDNICKYWAIFNCTILVSIFQYLDISNNFF